MKKKMKKNFFREMFIVNHLRMLEEINGHQIKKEIILKDKV